MEIVLSNPDPKIGVMLVGICGNNGSTFAATTLALKHGIAWTDKAGEHSVDLLGSLYTYGTISNPEGKPVLIKNVVELASPSNLVLTGWDIKSDNLYASCKLNGVLPLEVREKLKSSLEAITPLPSIFDPDFIATNQAVFVTNTKSHDTKWNNVCMICADINEFILANSLDSAPIVVWTASTERMHSGKWQTAAQLLEAIKANDAEVSPALQFAVATILCGGVFVNGSPQNTIGDALLELAQAHKAFAVGEDFKTGQTKLKSVLVDFLASSGIRPLSIVSYNHLGNNDGLNLSETPQFASKEFSKRSVIDDVVRDNPVLFKWGKALPDHLVRIDYVKAVGDSKRAMDEYHSELLFDGRSNIAIHNVCEDTLLAVPVIMDIVIFSDFMRRVKVGDRALSPELSLMAYFFKAPATYRGAPVVNAFFNQLIALRNFIRLCAGWPLPDFVDLKSRLLDG